MSKKIILLFAVTIIFILSSINVLAGDIPYSLLSDDKALLYIGEISRYDINAKTAAIQPTIKIKGDVDLDNSREVIFNQENVIRAGEYDEMPMFWNIGGKGFEENEQCLVIEFENMHEKYVFHISGDYPDSLTIENIDGMQMWEAFRDLLKEGNYEQAEKDRLERRSHITADAPENEISATDAEHSGNVQSNALAMQDDGLATVENEQKDSVNWGLVAVAFVISIVVFWKRRKRA